LLRDIDDNEKYIFYGPSAGGLKVQFAEQEIVVVTPGSPRVRQSVSAAWAMKLISLFGIK
jgi:hypothetical protein